MPDIESDVENKAPPPTDEIVCIESDSSDVANTKYRVDEIEYLLKIVKS